MSRWEAKYKRKEATYRRIEIKNILMKYYYDLFMSKFLINGLDYQESHYLLDSAWYKGKTAGFKLGGEDIPAFCDFTGKYFNRYNFPTQINLVPLKNDNGIPTKVLKLGEDVEICYFLQSRTPIRTFVENIVENIVDCRMVKSSNMFHMKNPYLIAVTPEDKARMKSIIDRIENDEDVIFCDMVDIQAMKNLINTTPYLWTN